MNKKFQPGFTLIEIMIAVVIVAILSAIALPAYQQYVIRAKRTDGRAALLNNHTALEKCKATFGVYNNAACTITAASPDGHYTVTVASTATTFTLTATPIGAQANDTECSTITLTNLAVEGGTGSDSSTCW